MFRQIAGGEILLIIVVLVLLFGARKLPDLARSLGASAKEFRKGVEEGSEEEQPTAEKSPTE
jgi:sec-independent protein translocase protein TatA